ncbi:MAG: glycosyltransferase [Candidatus Omnitrophica bacterium]|nr:glycosyltransferase [Candidatus Omnitrophota bacterium]
MMKVSVIIPTYNRAQYLKHALDSVFQQTYTDFEVVVVDGGSIDNTKEVLNDYKSAYQGKIKCFFCENKGAAAARNFGVKHASGEWIAFLDSDDLWLPYKLEQQIKFLDETPDVSLVYSLYESFDDRGSCVSDVLANYYKVLPQGNVLPELLLRCFIWTSTVVMRRNLFKEMNGFNERLRIGEDYDLWLRVAQKHQIGAVKNVLARYRQHDSNIMKEDRKNFDPSEVMVIQNFVKNNPKELEKVSDLEWKNRLAQPYFDLGYQLMHQGQLKPSRRFFKEAINRCPLNLVYYRYWLGSFLPDQWISYWKRKRRGL